MKTRILDKLYYGKTDPTPLGWIWIAGSPKGLAAIQIGGLEGSFTQKLEKWFETSPIQSEFEVFPAIQQIEAYLQGERPTFDLGIHWELLTSFQQKALRAVCAIPYGETRTYSQIAAQVGSPRAARAVGRANATNPLPLVIPCHRLIGTDGSLHGYGSGEGLKTKAWLLDLEKSNSLRYS